MAAIWPRPPGPFDVVGLDELPSRNDKTLTGAHQRMDPYHGGVWGAGSQAAWLSLEDGQRMAAAGHGRISARDLAMTDNEALAILSTPGLSRTKMLTVLAAVLMWRTSSREQLEAITGISGRQLSRSLAAGWTLGLLSRGQIISLLQRQNMPELWRVGRKSDLRQLMPLMSSQEWALVTAGQRWAVGSQYDRHNLIATELALRVAEYCPAAAVLGEHLGSTSLMTSGTVTSGKYADAVLVRADGGLVAVEVTASSSRNSMRKVASWMQLLTSTEGRHLAVLFVDASRPDDSGAGEALSDAILKAVATTPGVYQSGATGRILLARWRDWFPTLHGANRTFPTLPAVAPTGPAGDRWQDVNVLDPFSVDLAVRPGADVMLEQLTSLYGIPAWQRLGPGLDLSADLLVEAGMAGHPMAHHVPVQLRAAS